MNQPAFPFTALTPFADFETASRAILAYLHEILGFDLCMMTRKDGEDWIVLQVEDHGYDIAEGTVLHWSDSYCSRMVVGDGPRMALDAQQISAYAQAPINQAVPIGAYIGIPIALGNGSLFGTLCAIDPCAQTDSLEQIEQTLLLIELLARLLGTVLARDLKAIAHAELLAEMRKAALTDELTGLFNRRGWQQGLQAAESQAQQYGSPICVFIIDLDGLKTINDTQGHAQGDLLIQQTAQCLKQAAREQDWVARLGGDEFGILAIECQPIEAIALNQRLTDAFAVQGINASVGRAMRERSASVFDAVQAADRAMYTVKYTAKSATQSQPIPTADVGP